VLGSSRRWTRLTPRPILARRMLLLSLLAVGLALSLYACGGAGEAGREARLSVTGSSSVAPLMSEIAKRYESLHPGVRIDVQTGGSSRGVADVRSGAAQIGMVSRALNEDDADLRAFAIANDGIALIVHADNPVTSLVTPQVRALYTGEIRDWAQVGGRSAPVTVVNKAEGRSTLELFLDYLDLESAEVRAHVVIGDNEQGIKTVAGNPDAVGYVSIGSAESAVESGAPVKLLPLEGVAANSENVQNGSFPLSRRLNLVTREEPAGLAAELIAYAQSPEVADLVRQLNLVPMQ
jgi:phosphate transport system substrate-binding protein